MKSQVNKKLYIIYTILIAIACVFLVFTNISYDAEYQMGMAYRVIKGDKMITQMWEPHQTSAFLCAILMKIYMVLTGTTTGIVLYLQIAGLAIRGGIAFLFYKAVKKIAGFVPALIAGCIYLLVSPKELLTPEFGNMQLWFSTLMFLAIMHYFDTEKIRYLVISAIALCLGVFSYPSVVIVYIAVFVILLRYSKKPKRDILIFTGICAVIGGSFVAYILVTVGWDTLMKCLDAALSVEPSHTVNMFDKLWAHILNIAKIAGMLAGTATIGFAADGIVRLVHRKKKDEKAKFIWSRWLLISWYVLMVFLLCNILSVSNRGGYAFPFMVILIMGVLNRKLLSEKQKRMYDSAWLVSATSLIATLILSDNAFLQAITYMLIVICVSCVPIYHWYNKLMEKDSLRKMFKVAMHIFFLLIIFRCIFIHIPIYGRAQIYSIVSDVALIRSGPAAGIITEEDGAARQRDSMAEWKLYIKPQDTIWILGEPVDTLGYLYEDVEVGAPTVMSTPTYNEQLLYYWELNPDKFPDVVILASSFGELSWEVKTNEWLMQWLEEEFCADTVIDGNYWRYYIKRDNK